MKLLPKIAIAVLLPAVMGGSAALWLLNQRWQHGEQVLVQQAALGLQEQAHLLSDELDDQRATLRLLASSPSLAAPGLDALRADLRAWSAALPGFEGLYLLTLDGLAMPADGPAVQVGDRPYFQQVLQGREVTAEPLVSRISGRAVLVHVVPVRWADGRLRGGLRAAAPLDGIFKRLTQPRAEGGAADGRLLLVDARGQRLAGSLDTPLPPLVPADPAQAPVTHAVLAAWQAQSAAVQQVQAAGRSWHVLQAPAGPDGWRLLLVQSDDDLLSSMRQARRQAGLVLGLTLLLVLLGGWTVHRLVARRVGALLLAQDQLQRGDMAVRVPVDGHDELGQLSQSFNRMAESLQAADQRFRTIFEALPTPVSLTELDSQRYVDINPAFEAVTGWRRDEVLGRRMVDLGMAVDPQTWRDNNRTLRRTGRLDEAVGATRDPQGRTRWWLYTERIITLSGQQRVLTVTTEITQTREAQAKLRDNQRLLTRVFNLLPEPLALINANDGVYVDVNRRWEQLMGLSRESVVGQSVISLGLMSSAEEAMRLRQELVDTGEVKPTLLRVPRPVGPPLDWEVSARLVEMEGQKIGVWATHDVTDRLAAERAMAQSEQRFRELFDQSPVAMLFADQAGRVVAASRAWLQLVGYGQDELRTLDDWWAKVAADPARGAAESRRWAAAVAGQAQGDGPARPIEVLVRCKDGHSRILLLGGAQVDQGLIVSAMDITERQRIEAELHDLASTLEHRVQQRTAELQTALDGLRHAQDELVRSEKLASLGALVAGVAHELNTPIGNAVLVASTLAGRQQAFEQGMADGLRRSALQAFLDGLREVSMVLERNLQRAADLVGGFKQLAVDQTSYQRRRFQLHAVVQENVLALSPTLRAAGVRLVDQTDPALQLDSYPGPLGQVLVNLVNNAVVHAFAPEAPGTVTVVTHGVQAGWVHLSVEDDGRGIAPDNLRRVFDPFFTTRLGQGGSGLGLHIVYSLVTGLLGGRIEVHSPVAQGGTRFDIRLPLVAPLATTDETSGPAPTRP